MLSHYRGQKPKSATKQELDGLGMKVFGLTGEEVIATLKALQLVQVIQTLIY
jgi:Protein of unknown function (DUF3161)